MRGTGVVMRSSIGALTAALFLTSIGAAIGETQGLTGNTFVNAFNEAAARNHVDKTAKFEKCTRTSECQYRISDRTVIIVYAKTRDDPVKQLVVLTANPKALPVKDLFSAEDAEVWAVAMQALNPEVSSERRSEIISKFATAVKASNQPSFKAKIGTNRYFAAAAPDIGVWLAVGVNPSKSDAGADGAAGWRQRIRAWIDREHGADKR